MEFKEALKILNIEDYEDRIMKSNSHGELFHCVQYIQLAEFLKRELTIEPDKFREWFIYIVGMAKKEWKRPESIYQHIYTIFKDNTN